MVKLAPALTLAVLIGPVMVGLVGTLLPAFGYLPTLGGTSLSLAPFTALLGIPGLPTSIMLSLGTGLAATFGAFTAVVLFTAAFLDTRPFRIVHRLLSPLMALPHAAAALGLAFLVAPSGWLMRLASPFTSDLGRPPDLLILNDPAGIAMTFGLIAKEVPFLFLMVLAALPQANAAATRRVAASLGYAPVAAFLKTVLPRLYPQIRLPVLAVLAYATSVVDVAMILGPTTPAPLAVRLTQWMGDPDLSQRFVASAGAVLQFGITLTAIAIWLTGERLLIGLGRGWSDAGGRSAADRSVSVVALALVAVLVAALILGIAAIALWSLAGPWRYPAPFPETLSVMVFAHQLPTSAPAIATTLAIGLPVAALAVVLALACLENETRHGLQPGTRALALLYLPLLVPQVTFLFGLQVLYLTAGFGGSALTVAFAHLVFVLPYVFLALADSWRAIDPRYGAVASSLRATPIRTFWRIRLPLALRAVVTAAALGFAVSVAQYLPTLIVGGGRVTSITTEAVALASGGNRRLIAHYALLQMLLSLLGFAFAALVPALVFRNRRALRTVA